MSYLKKIDHVTYACQTGKIEQWAWFHIVVEGGTLIKRIDDVNPEGKSSMKIWCIDYGDFGIALIEGIDREERSQVTAFTDRHGDHSCQHVAFDCYDLEKFQEHMKALGGHPRGDTIIQDDGFGILKQMFAKGYATGHAGEATFPEYCERPKTSGDIRDLEITFSEMAGEGFYGQVQKAIDEDDDSPFFDFKKMPADWDVPAVQEKTGDEIQIAV